MISKIWNFICEKGYVLMSVGVAIVSVAAITLFLSKQSGGKPGTYLWTAVSFGMAVYIVGRIGVFFKTRRLAAKESATEKEPED